MTAACAGRGRRRAFGVNMGLRSSSPDMVVTLT